MSSTTDQPTDPLTLQTLPPHLNSDASLIYSYHRLNHTLPAPSQLPSSPSNSQPQSPKSAIICLCSLDTRMAHYASHLLLQNYADILIFSGNVGKLTEGKFAGVPEAEVFKKIAVEECGVEVERVFVEGESRNTGENCVFTYRLLEERGWVEGLERVVLVQKPYMERRTLATFMKQWLGYNLPPPQSPLGNRDDAVKEKEKKLEVFVTSLPLSWEEYPNEENPRGLVTSIMVGDLARMKIYARLGFQVEVEVPEEVWKAGERLAGSGFGGHTPEGFVW